MASLLPARDVDSHGPQQPVGQVMKIYVSCTYEGLVWFTANFLWMLFDACVALFATSMMHCTLFCSFLPFWMLLCGCRACVCLHDCRYRSVEKMPNCASFPSHSFIGGCERVEVCKVLSQHRLNPLGLVATSAVHSTKLLQEMG